MDWIQDGGWIGDAAACCPRPNLIVWVSMQTCPSYIAGADLNRQTSCAMEAYPDKGMVVPLL